MSTYAALIDVKKAYATVWRQELWKSREDLDQVEGR